MKKLLKEDKNKIKAFNRKTKLQERKVAKYMNNIIKYNVILIYHSSKNKTIFTDKCMKMFRNYGNKDNIKFVCKELYNIFKDNKNIKTKKAKHTKKHLNAIIASISHKKSKKGKITHNKNASLKGGEIEGPYLQRLTTKGNEAITGDDMAKAVDEIITVLDDIQYLDDAPNVKGFNALFKFFNGDPEGLKQHLKYSIAPQFYSTFPPALNIGKIYERWDNTVDILNAYKNDKKIKLKFAVEKGLKPEDVLKPSFLDKFAERFDMIDQKFQQINRARKGQFIV